MDTKDINNSKINESIEINTGSYDTLVLSGGSSKGIMTLGALQYLVDNFLFDTINTYIGTSSGAMICFLLAIGYSPIEIIVYICTHHFMEKIQNFNVLGMINGSGAASFASIQEELEKMTISKIGYLPTMKDIYVKYGKKLVFSTYNLSHNKTEYLSHETYPDLPCITALHMSANLPLIFEKFSYNNSFYIDGGIADNFPIDLADQESKKIIGLVIDNDSEKFNNDMDIIEYIYHLFYIPSTQAVEFKINKVSNKCKIIKLQYNKINLFNFNIDSKTKLEMFSIGYNIAKTNMKEV
jgi:predicted acylesterase/phospholipase RssA